MNPFRYISRWFRGLADVFANELHTIFHDPGVILFFVVLPLAYPLVYTLIYNKEVVREIPVAVIDNSRTAMSRELVRNASASPTIQIYDYCANMAEAKRLMAEQKVYGIMEIPSDYARNIGNGETSHVMFYSEMSLLLRYRAFMAALTDLQIEMASDINDGRIRSLGAESYLTGDSPLPIASESNFLGDTEQGFASFVIPGIVVLILQQSMLLGIGMIAGTSRERRRRTGGIDPHQPDHAPLSATVWGKTLCYFVFYIAFTIYNLHIVPMIFNLPHFGSPADYFLFIVPMLLAVAFLGQTIAPIMRERESPFVLIVATSVVFLFLSGLTWPRYAMSPLWHSIGNCIPATWGVEGFVRINTNSATLGENSTPYLWLWGLAAVYMCTAMVSTAYLRRLARRQAAVAAAPSEES